MTLRRIARLTIWVLREPAQWRIALLLLLVILFAATSSVAHVGDCGGTLGQCQGPPEEGVGTVLDFTVRRVVALSYPFIFPIVSILVTLTIVVQREGGNFATLLNLGYRRYDIMVTHGLGILILGLVPGLIAFILLPTFVEPRLFLTGNAFIVYQPRYWASMPRFFLMVLFTVLFAGAFAMIFRRASIAFGVMITFFFFGWYLQVPLGTYGVLTPSGSFTAAYGLYRSLPGVPLDPNYVFLIYLVAGIAAFVSALLYVGHRGEM